MGEVILTPEEREEYASAVAEVAILARPQMIAAARLQLTCAALQALPYVDSRYSPELAASAVAIADACLALLYPEPSASDGGGGERG